VRKQLGDKIGLIVDGGTSPRDVASTILDMSEPGKCDILRLGAIPEHELAEYVRYR
jgi:tRNA A37 threonylcarbamoyladenosine synthetase subunit TsaC/SUA5/YrdC